MKTGQMVTAAAVVFVVAATALALAHGPGASRWGGWGGAPMNPGMMMGHHPMMMGQGPGMMGGGPMMGMMGYGPGTGDRGSGWAGRMPMWGPEPSRTFTADDIRRIVDGRLAWRRNDRLKIGKVEERDANTVVVEIVTVDGSVVDRIGIDRNTGRGRRAP